MPNSVTVKIQYHGTWCEDATLIGYVRFVESKRDVCCTVLVGRNEQREVVPGRFLHATSSSGQRTVL